MEKTPTTPPPPAGTVVHLAFRVIGYSNDGIAILEHVDRNGKSLGWVNNQVVLNPDTYLLHDAPQT